MHPKVSVIIPVYNVESLLKRCLDSLAAQNLEEIEFICIDDGSTDQSGLYLDQYSDRDKRFKVFHTPNRGVSSARNLGLSYASGDFITFCDSDDYVEPGIYETLYTEADRQQADVVICDVLQKTLSGDIILDCSWECHPPCQLIKELFSWRPVAIWNKLIRRSLIHPGIFAEDCTYLEDRFVWFKIVHEALNSEKGLTSVHIPDTLYCYDTASNDGSLTRRPKKILLQQTLQGYDLIFTELGQDQGQYRNNYSHFILELAFSSFWNKPDYQLNNKEYIDLFTPYKPFFDELSPSLKRSIVLQAISGNSFKTLLLKLLYYPRVIIDKSRIILDALK